MLSGRVPAATWVFEVRGTAPAKLDSSIIAGQNRERLLCINRFAQFLQPEECASVCLFRSACCQFDNLSQMLQPGDFVVLLGAGNISAWAYGLPKTLNGTAA